MTWRHLDLRGRRALALVPVLLALGCSSDHVSGASVLPGTLWRLQTLQKPGAPPITVDPQRYTAEFAAGILAARADCNTCRGGYRAASIVIDIGTLSCTRVACPPGSLGNDYVTILQDADLFVEEGDVLVITAPSGTLRFAP
jgi:heat shock protein HslJ